MQERYTHLPVGKVIRDRYVVEGLLGKGGFGAVYLVRDARVRHNLFALKELVEADKKDRERFEMEGQLLTRLEHPALPRVYRLFENAAEHRVYMLMDYIDAPNLEMFRREQPEQRFAVVEALNILAPVMEAVAYLHRQNPPILHRDIKPSNILRPTTGESTVLVDFGIAKEFDEEATTTATRYCSPGYGAPEQYAKGTSPRTDIYGLGATLYALLTGSVPVDAMTRVLQVSSGGGDPLDPPDYRVPTIPSGVARAVVRALSLKSDERFASVDEFWEALCSGIEPEELSLVATSTSAFPVEENHALEVPEPSLISLPLSRDVPSAPSHAAPQIQVRPSERTKSTVTRRLRIWPLLIAFMGIGLLMGVSLFSLYGLHIFPGASPLVRTTQTGVQATTGSTVTAASTYTPVQPGTTPTRGSAKAHPTAAISPTSPAHVPPAPTGNPSPVPTATPFTTRTPTPTPTVVVPPNIAGIYTGNIDDTTANIITGMALSIQQKAGQSGISGYFSVNPPLTGNGNFSGSVNTARYVQFIVQAYQNNAPLYFWGWVQADKSLKGNYCSLNTKNQCDPAAGAAGTWNVALTSSG